MRNTHKFIVYFYKNKKRFLRYTITGNQSLYDYIYYFFLHCTAELSHTKMKEEKKRHTKLLPLFDWMNAKQASCSYIHLQEQINKYCYLILHSPCTTTTKTRTIIRRSEKTWFIQYIWRTCLHFYLVKSASLHKMYK